MDKKNKPTIYYKTILYSIICCITLNLIFFRTGTTGPTINLNPKILINDNQRKLYTESLVPTREAINYTNNINIKNLPVLFYSQPLVAKIKAKPMFTNWYNFLLHREIIGAWTKPEMQKILIEKNIEYIIIEKNYELRNVRNLLKELSEKIWEAEDKSIQIRKTIKNQTNVR